MIRKLAIALAVAASLSLAACGSMTMDDGGRYDGYRQSAVQLAIAAQETERTRIAALAQIAANGDSRTQDRIVAELSGRGAPSGSPGVQLQAPAAPTHLGLEALRVLGPGAIGLIGQGIGAWSQNQADILATQRSVETNSLIQSTINQALTTNTQLGQRGMDLTGQAMSLIPPTHSTTVINMPGAAEAAPAATQE